MDKEMIQAIIDARTAKGMSQKDLAYFLEKPYEFVFMLENGGVGLSNEKCQDILDRLTSLNAPVHYQVEAEYSCDLPVNRDGLVTLPKKILDELHISPDNMLVQITEHKNRIVLNDSFMYKFCQASKELGRCIS